MTHKAGIKAAVVLRHAPQRAQGRSDHDPEGRVDILAGETAENSGKVHHVRVGVSKKADRRLPGHQQAPQDLLKPIIREVTVLLRG